MRGRSRKKDKAKQKEVSWEKGATAPPPPDSLQIMFEPLQAPEAPGWFSKLFLTAAT